MARLWNQPNDVRQYAQVRQRLIAKVNRDEFLHRGNGLYGGGDQGCQALAVHQNVAPSELRDAVARNLISNVTQTHANHLNTVPAKASDAVDAPAPARFVEMAGGCAVFEAAGGTHVFRSVPAEALNALTTTPECH